MAVSRTGSNDSIDSLRQEWEAQQLAGKTLEEERLLVEPLVAGRRLPNGQHCQYVGRFENLCRLLTVCRVDCRELRRWTMKSTRLSRIDADGDQSASPFEDTVLRLGA